MYWCWLAEEILSESIKNYNRSELFIASKVRWSNASYKAIKKACENSLKRVWTDYFDLYYIHWREIQFNLKDCMQAMEELVDEGKIKYIGVSNFSKESLIEAQSYCKKYKIVANQVHYNLIYREAEVTWLLDHCQENDIILVAYRPFELWKIPNGSKLNKYEKKYNKSATQIAVNWLISQKNITAIFHSKNTENIKETILSENWKLSTEDILEMKNDYHWQIDISDCIALL